MGSSGQPQGKQKKDMGMMGHTRTPFGPYELQTIGSEHTHVSFVAERSAYVHQVRIAGHDLLLNHSYPAELSENSWYRNHALLPFPNRLFEGRYTWNEQSLAFEINDPGSASALHGFGASASFKVERLDMTADRGKVKLVYLHRPAQHLHSYPFFIRFEVELSVDLVQQQVEWKMSAVNLGTASAPVGIGWHPYFALPGGSEDWLIQMPPNEQIALKNSIPTGAFLKGLSSKQPIRIQSEWDDCFALSDPKKLEVGLIGKAYSLSLKQLGTTRYTQLYVPGDQQSIAIEPMTCGVNAFIEGKAEVSLNPQEEVTTGMSIQLINTSS